MKCSLCGNEMLRIVRHDYVTYVCHACDVSKCIHIKYDNENR